MRPDDSTIEDGTHLLRALPFEGWWTLQGDRSRPSSLAFYDGYSGETSCHIDTPDRRARYAAQYSDKPAARFTARQARECGFNVTSDPEGDPDGDAEHKVLTFGEDAFASKNKYHRACKQLALLAELLPASALKDV